MINTLSGSEEQRFNEIHNKWLVFEPISDEKYAINYSLFSVDIGQIDGASIEINSGSIQLTNNVCTIEKDVHIFYDETEALEFITNIGEDNLISFQQLITTDNVGRQTRIYEVHVVNYPVIDLEFNNKNVSQDLGYKLDVYVSGAVDDTSRVTLEEATKKIVLNKNGTLVSDTYERFFTIESDK